MGKNILLTGGAGFIGSHTASELIARGYTVFVVDNFSNASPKVFSALKQLTGVDIPFKTVDINNTAELAELLQLWKIDAVIHFAALKSVSESVQKPTLYYRNNVSGTISLLEAMRIAKVQKVLFSSSATVYGALSQSPITESAPISAINPYGQSKVMMEQIVMDEARAAAGFTYGILRYFNPVGAHPSGLIGENPNGVPSNLMPYIQKVAAGELAELPVFGDDYPTNDGTGERDYVHIMALVEGHILALQHLLEQKPSFVCNLGTGKACSVKTLIETFERVNSISIPYAVKPRRAGDVSCVFADTAYAKTLLGFESKYSIDDMCADAWRFQRLNHTQS